MNKNKLVVDKLTKKYGNKDVVKGVSIELDKGEVVILHGKGANAKK